jgi:hypothetical protein
VKSRRLGKRAARAQRGFALIAILALAALIAAFLISSALNRSSADVANDREQRSMDALRQAKAALIAYAAAVDWKLQVSCTPPGCYLQPGSLPCPDVNGTGTSDCASGSASASMIGRLPWVTMGIDDLRDASGEQIWYALSHDFRKEQCTSLPDSPPSPPGCTKINSDTQGQLSVTGAVSASNVVAVLIAPGGPIQGQVRPNNAVGSYVESFAAGDGVHFTFTTNAMPDQNINDRILVITQPELMAAVEPVVAARIEKDIAPRVKAYYDTFKAYPFPAPFVAATGDPSRAWTEYKGSTTQAGGLPQVSGLLPLTTASGFLTWRTSATTVTQIPGGTGTGQNGPSNPSLCTFPGGDSSSFGCTIQGVDCSASTSTLINCRIDYAETHNDWDRPAIALQATLNNAALSFPKPIGPTDLSMTDYIGNPVQLDPITGPWSPTDVPGATPTYFMPSVDYTAAPDGSVRMVIKGRLQNQSYPDDGTGGRVRVRIPVPTAYDVVTSTDLVNNPDNAWFILNEWFRQTYYAVSAGHLPGGGQACTLLPTTPPSLSASPPFYCLRVTNLRPALATPDNNKRAIIILAGRSLNGVNRPTSNLAAYFENANLTAANGTSPFVYENRVGLPTSINDRVVLVP